MPRGTHSASVIDTYRTTVLQPQLHDLQLTPAQVRLIGDDIRQRLQSLLGRWDDPVFRATALLLGTEDATWYEPRAVPLPIRALVAVGVRNSMLEDITASRPSVPALRTARERLRDDQVPIVTGRAVLFFGQYYQAHEQWGVPQPYGNDDCFGGLARTYPHTWERLRILATAPGQEHDLVAAGAQVFALPPAPALQGQVRIDPVVLSGYDPAIDPALAAHLTALCAGQVPVLFTPTLKWLTRNPAKLLYVIETVLAANATFCTFNYVIRRDYCARRARLVRPPHTEDEIAPLLRRTDGLVPRHRTVLQHVAAAADEVVDR